MSYFNGEASHWLAASPADDIDPVPLPRGKQDLVIVGGGLTGLWSAYYARQAHPEWAITIIEARHIGYGASGRNGGWLSTLLPGNRTKFAEAVDRARKNDPSGPVGSAGLDGVASVSAPVRNPRGEVIAAISVSGPIDRMGRRPGARWAADLLQAAEALQRRI